MYVQMTQLYGFAFEIIDQPLRTLLITIQEMKFH